MFPPFTYDFAKDLIEARHREAARYRIAREASRRSTQPVRAAIELRISACRGELERLAALSERTLRGGDWIVADVNGVPVAAVSLEDGSTLYDPFRPSMQALSLLKLRRKQVLAAA